MKRNIRVAHFLPHVGGGVGTVLRAMVDESVRQGGFEHIFVTLDYCNERTRKWANDAGIDFLEKGWIHWEQVAALLESADVVHVHWWNHPLLQAVLINKKMPIMRLVIWSHVNGMSAPQSFYERLICYPDCFVVATPYSLESSYIKNLDESVKLQSVRYIQSSAGIPSFAPEDFSKPKGCSFGYVGSVDYSKMHSDIISIWERTGITDSPYLVCGGEYHEQFRKEVVELGLTARFDIRGPVSNVGELFRNMHVFAYPLNDSLNGTGEQVIIEAMSCGAVPVVFNNGCEQFLVKDGFNGICVDSVDEFVQALKFLRDNPVKRNELARNAFESIRQRHSISKTVGDWHDCYAEMMTKSKRVVAEKLDQSPLEVLLTSYGNSREADFLRNIIEGKQSEFNPQKFLSAACLAPTRGSPFHYQHWFPEDVELKEICLRLRSGQVDYQKNGIEINQEQ